MICRSPGAKVTLIVPKKVDSLLAHYPSGSVAHFLENSSRLASALL